MDGVLAIDLKIVVTEEMRPRKINIGKTSEETKNDTRQQLNEKRN